MKEFIGRDVGIAAVEGGKDKLGAGSDNMVRPFPFPTHTPTFFNR